MNRAASDVVENIHVTEQVELLKDHADLAALCRQCGVRHGHCLAVTHGETERRAVDRHLALVGSIKKVQGAQQCAFAAPAWPDNDDDLAPPDHKVHVVENLERTKRLVYAARLNDDRTCR